MTLHSHRPADRALVADRLPAAPGRPRGRRGARWLALAASALLVAGCDMPEASVDYSEELADSPFSEDNLNQIMLTVASSGEAVDYFREALARNPDDPEMMRGYARSLVKNGQQAEARFVYRDLADSGMALPGDHVDYAIVLARLDMWGDAKAQRMAIASDYDSDRLAMLEGLLADHEENWARADEAYERARRQSPQPAAVLNNWGVSMMARGDHSGAERKFEEALIYDPGLFNAKNNMAISYALTGRYRLPLVTLTDEERAMLLHNMGVIALRQGDQSLGRDLLRQSVAVHPQHYAPSADKLAQLAGQGAG